MPEYVRVKDKSTGHHYTVLAQVAENDPEAYTVLKQPAVDANGDPLPGEIPGTAASAAASKPPKKRAAASKPPKKRAAAKKAATPKSPSSDTNQGQSATDTTEES